MKEETIEQIEDRLEEMKKLQAQNPIAKVVYNTWEKQIEISFPVTRKEEKCISCGYEPNGRGWLISNPVKCPECLSPQETK